MLVTQAYWAVVGKWLTSKTRRRVTKERGFRPVEPSDWGRHCWIVVAEDKADITKRKEFLCKIGYKL